MSSDHLRDANLFVGAAVNDLLKCGARSAEVTALMMAVRHQAAEEVRRDLVAIPHRVPVAVSVALASMTGNLDPYRYDTEAKVWKVK